MFSYLNRFLNHNNGIGSEKKTINRLSSIVRIYLETFKLSNKIYLFYKWKKTG